MFQYMHYLFNETEIRFYKKYKLFPDELFQQLQNLGFSRESFKPIQKEMDRLFLLQKEESTWQKQTATRSPGHLLDNSNTLTSPCKNLQGVLNHGNSL